MAYKRIAIGAAVALAAAVVLRRLGVEPVPTVFYLLAWYPTLLLLDAVVAAKGGPSLWDQPRDTAAMVWWSVVIWCAFEALNFRLRDWYYVFVPASPSPARCVSPRATCGSPSCWARRCWQGRWCCRRCCIR